MSKGQWTMDCAPSTNQASCNLQLSAQVIVMAAPNRNNEIKKKTQLFIEFPFILSQ